MKKVEKVSIAEISFTLDNDAYSAMRQYLDKLGAHYASDPDGREIMRDIEGRIAELILDRQVYTKVVSLPLVESIIAQLGTPEEIDTEEIKPTTETSDTAFPRRLHRSRQGGLIGGVCSGIAQFLDVSVAWIRLAFLLPAVLYVIARPLHWWPLSEFAAGWMWVFIVTYVVLWIALPLARTPRQKLEARGERITAESIRQNIQSSATTPAGRRAASVTAELVTVLARVALFFVKFVCFFVGFGLLVGALALLVGVFAVIFEPVNFVRIDGMNLLSNFEGMQILSPVIFAVVVLLCVFLPLFVMGMAVYSFVFGWRLRRTFYTVSLALWGVMIAVMIVTAIANANFFNTQVHDRLERWEGRYHHHHHSPNRVDIRPVPADSLETWQADSIAN